MGGGQQQGRVNDDEAPEPINEADPVPEPEEIEDPVAKDGDANQAGGDGREVKKQ